MNFESWMDVARRINVLYMIFLPPYYNDFYAAMVAERLRMLTGDQWWTN